jgi:hypothetical protein
LLVSPSLSVAPTLLVVCPASSLGVCPFFLLLMRPVVVVGVSSPSLVLRPVPLCGASGAFALAPPRSVVFATTLGPSSVPSFLAVEPLRSRVLRPVLRRPLWVLRPSTLRVLRPSSPSLTTPLTHVATSIVATPWVSSVLRPSFAPIPYIPLSARVLRPSSLRVLRPSYLVPSYVLRSVMRHSLWVLRPSTLRVLRPSSPSITTPLAYVATSIVTTTLVSSVLQPYITPISSIPLATWVLRPSSLQVLRPSYLVPSCVLRSVMRHYLWVLRPSTLRVLRPYSLSITTTLTCVITSIVTTSVVLRPYSTTITSVTLSAWVLRPSSLRVLRPSYLVSSNVLRPSSHVRVSSLVVRWLRDSLIDLWLLRPAPSSSSLLLAVLGHRRLYSPRNSALHLPSIGCPKLHFQKFRDRVWDCEWSRWALELHFTVAEPSCVANLHSGLPACRHFED